MHVVRDVRIAARDGTSLCLDVYLPDGDGPFPTLHAVSPYQKDLAHLPACSAFRFRETGPIEWWVSQGYAYVFADQRGTGKSEGTFALFSRAEQEDYYDTIEWIATQPWSNGRVAMIGESGFSINQWLAATLNPPHLACVLIYNGLTDLYRDACYHGGIFSMGFLNFWSADNVRASAMIGGPTPVPSQGIGDFYGDVLRHPTYDEWWAERVALPRVKDITAPVLVVGWWYNVGLHLRGTLLGFEEVRAPKKLLVLAGTDSHERFFEPEFLTEYIAPWYDYWLKGVPNGVMDDPPVRIAIQGTSVIRAEEAWPLARAVPTPYYLQPGPAHAVKSLNDGALASTPPPAGTSPTRYRYPNPDWTVGTTIIGPHGVPDSVRGILSFTTAPLAEDVEVTGPIVLVLYASSDQADTEFFVKLSEQQSVPALRHLIMDHVAGDVPPPATMVTRGWLKASHREPDPERSTPQRPHYTHAHPTPLEPNTIYRFEIEVWPTAYLFRKGNRIRLELANGDSMIGDGLFHHYYGHKVGVDTIYHDAEHPSHLVLPVVPAH